MCTVQSGYLIAHLQCALESRKHYRHQAPNDLEL